LKRLVTLAACAALLTACSPQKAAAPKPAASTAQPTYNYDLPMAEMMGHVVDPAAWTYWRGSGTEVTAKGERDLSPTTEEGWTELENGAATLIEAGNLLQLPGRGREPVADWNKYAQQLTARGVEAKAAAEKHDKDGVYKKGAEVYEVCTACHRQFVIEPTLKAQGGPGTATLKAFPQDVEKKIENYSAKH
jgi:hypothetical protein